MTKVNPIPARTLRSLAETVRSESSKRGIIMAAYANQRGGFTLYGQPTTLNGISNLVYVANQEKN